MFISNSNKTKQSTLHNSEDLPSYYLQQNVVHTNAIHLDTEIIILIRCGRVWLAAIVKVADPRSVAELQGAAAIGIGVFPGTEPHAGLGSGPDLGPASYTSYFFVIPIRAGLLRVWEYKYLLFALVKLII